MQRVPLRFHPQGHGSNASLCSQIAKRNTAAPRQHPQTSEAPPSQGGHHRLSHFIYIPSLGGRKVCPDFPSSSSSHRRSSTSPNLPFPTKLKLFVTTMPVPRRWWISSTSPEAAKCLAAQSRLKVWGVAASGGSENKRSTCSFKKKKKRKKNPKPYHIPKLQLLKHIKYISSLPPTGPAPLPKEIQLASLIHSLTISFILKNLFWFCMGSAVPGLWLCLTPRFGGTMSSPRPPA